MSEQLKPCLTVEQCAQQFELYAQANGKDGADNPERVRAYRHCAEFLTEFCTRAAQPEKEKRRNRREENSICVCAALGIAQCDIHSDL